MLDGLPAELLKPMWRALNMTPERTARFDTIVRRVHTAVGGEEWAARSAVDLAIPARKEAVLDTAAGRLAVEQRALALARANDAYPSLQRH